jgi:aspartyl-tRNA(Asn)/glutamyl-tRNA(Gln) amidotransferase subunit A
VGVQFLAPLQADDRLYNAAAALERLLVARWGGPLAPPPLETQETR